MNEEPDAHAPQCDSETSDEPPVDDTAQLPAIESLDEHSDYRAFMSDKVSEELRLQALRKLFRLPQFNVCDGLNDYDEDFASCKPLGSIVTHDMARGLDRMLEKAGASASGEPPVAAVGNEAALPHQPASPDRAPARATREAGTNGNNGEPPTS